MKMQFCPYCGMKLDDGARFCKNCDESIVNNAQEAQKPKREQRVEENPTERKTVDELKNLFSTMPPIPSTNE